MQHYRHISATFPCLCSSIMSLCLWLLLMCKLQELLKGKYICLFSTFRLFAPLRMFSYIYSYIYIYIHTHIYIYIYIYIHISSHKWSMTHRVLRSLRSKMSIIYMQSWNNVPSGLSPEWLCGYSCTWASCAQVYELPQSHCGDNQECTLFSWLHTYKLYIPLDSPTIS